MNILGVETTCDETSLALVRDGTEVIQEITISEAKKHSTYGGVVPDLAARDHLTNLEKMIEVFLKSIKPHRIDAVAVAAKVGLPSAVAVGEAFAYGLVETLNKPIVEVNHAIAHMWGVFVDSEFKVKPTFPLVALIVSGGHTQIIYFETPIKYEILGTTVDDALGETFDKVAALLGLPYPGGPNVEMAAQIGDRFSHEFPIPLENDTSLNFSFSGLKTAVGKYCEKQIKEEPEFMHKYLIADVCAAFQYSAFTSIINKLLFAYKKRPFKELVIGGGVAANQTLVNMLWNSFNGRRVELYAPHLKYCGDNASLVAGYGFNLL